MNKNKILIIISLITVSFLSADPALAAGLVPCGGKNEPKCTPCHFFQLLHNVMSFLMKLAFIIAPIIVVACGIMFLVASGNQNIFKIAKEGFIAVIIGLGIILLAWVIVTAIFSAVGVKKELGRWYEIECPVE